jgi:flavodoxin
MSKNLIVYYSWSGNTRKIAEQIRSIAGGDTFEILPVQPYPENYNKCTEQAKKEINAGHKPSLRNAIKNIDEYDTVFVGTPNWWSTIAPPITTFLLEYDLSGKTVIPFCTHDGGGVARCHTDIVKLTPKSQHLDGLAVSGNRVDSAKSDVEKWLRNIKVTE